MTTDLGNSSRKLAAILAADVAGYSRLMGDDERATVRTLTEYRAVFVEHIGQCRGKLVDAVGDSVLATFDSSVEAVECAVKIQGDLARRNRLLADHRQMKFRIGINLGDVIAREDGTIYGDDVNIAARIESLAQAGGISVSGTVHDHVDRKLAIVLKFAGEHRVKNIAKVVRIYSWEQDSAHASTIQPSMTVTESQASDRTTTSRIGLVALFTAFFVIAALGAWWYAQRSPMTSAKIAVSGNAAPVPSDKPSIAVLPFVNMSGDKDQEYFSDGITEDVITSLSKLSGLFVIARNSVFTYKGEAVKPEQVSKELGVRYVLEGSVRKADNQVRITAQLIDATNGYHLWAEHYDGEFRDIFKLQDDVTKRIVAALSPKLAPHEGSANSTPETMSVEAYDLYLRAKPIQSKVIRENLTTVRRMYEQAIALDPNYARPYAGLAWSYWDEYIQQWSTDPENLPRAIAMARKAVALNGSLSEARRALGFLLLAQKQHDAGLAELEKAVQLDPNFSWAYAMLAYGRIYVGKPEEALGLAKKALQLDPKCEGWVALPLGESYYWLRRYDEAIVAMRDAIARSPKYPSAHRFLAATYAESGRENEARAEVDELLRLNPAFKLDVYRARIPYKNESDVTRLVAALRKAGLK